MTASHYPLTAWMEFYEKIKDPSWPACYNEHHFYSLPDWIQQEILDVHNGRSHLGFTDHDIFTIQDENLLPSDTGNHKQTFDPECKLTYPVGDDFFVYYDNYLEGSGTQQGQEFPKVLKYLYPNRSFDYCLDWCCGAGFIGFRLLADGIVKNVTMYDVFQPAISACKKTAENMPNKFKNTVKFVQLDNVEQLTTDYQFDLIVGTPPAYGNYLLAQQAIRYYKSLEVSLNDSIRIVVDNNWNIRRNFYANIKKNLTNNGVILIQENLKWNQPSVFKQMIEDSGLKIVRTFSTSSFGHLWYLEVTHK
jgi:16S rRNA G966 N2-methylase RsmD